MRAGCPSCRVNRRTRETAKKRNEVAAVAKHGDARRMALVAQAGMPVLLNGNYKRPLFQGLCVRMGIATRIVPQTRPKAFPSEKQTEEEDGW